MKIQDKLVCPKCQTRSLRKAHGRNPIGEMFCDKDREYFTIWELINIWGFDAGDFVNQNNVSLLPKKQNCEHSDLQDYPPFIPKMFQYGKQCKECWEIFIPDTEFNMLNGWWEDDTVSPVLGEPRWQSPQEREEAYEMVHRMFMGIPEYDDYQDLKNTQDDAVGRML